jgi:hypothetical protein
MAVVFQTRQLQWIPDIANALGERFVELKARILVQFGFLDLAAGIAERVSSPRMAFIGNYTQFHGSR